MSTQPTALAQLRHLYQNMLNGGVRDTASAKRIAEGLLGPAIEALERGTPATGGEPVAWVDERAISWLENRRSTSANITTKLTRQKSLERPMPLYTSPQPVREPLSDEQIKDLIGFGDPTEQEKHLIRMGFNAAHGIGITGGQHG